ncbi:MAG: peptidylprolyl isomerase [Bacteroidales bacterium]
MKKLVVIAYVIGIMFVYIGCKCSSDVLARYDDTAITRGQFKQWLKDKQFSVDTILKIKKQQQDKLEMMALEDIALRESIKENMLTTEKFKFLEDMAFESVLLKRLYDEDIKESSDFNEPAYHIKQILLRVRDFKIVNNKRVDLSKSEKDKILAEAQIKAKEIIARIKNGEKFDDIARQLSDDFSKKNGGDIGFVVSDMISPQIYAAIEKANDGQLIEDPIVTPQGVYIVQRIEKQNVNKKNIHKIIKDTMQAKRLEQVLWRKVSNKFIEDLMNANDVQFDETKCTSKNPKDVIYRVGDVQFLVEDLNTRLSFFNQGHNPFGKITIDDARKVEIAKNSYKVALLRREAMKQKIHENEEFKNEVEKRKKMLFAKEYMNTVADRGVVITPKEIHDEYEKYKDTRFSTFINKNGKKIKQLTPYDKVKDQLESLLYRKKRTENLSKWKRDMLHIYKFTVNTDELEGK